MDFRKEHTSEWRAGEVRHTIDPGFIHHRKIETILGESGMKVIDEQIRRLPPDLPEWQRQVRVDHIYSRTMLVWCEVNHVKSLGDVLAREAGKIFCSNVELGPCPEFFDKKRVTSLVLLDGEYAKRVELWYSTRHVFGDTPRERLQEGGFVFSVIAELSRVDGDLVVFEPIVIGFPWLEAGEKGLISRSSPTAQHVADWRQIFIAGTLSARYQPLSVACELPALRLACHTSTATSKTRASVQAA